MKRKLMVTMCSFVFILGCAVNSYAGNSKINVDDNVTVLDSDQTPVFTGGKLSRAAKVTDSHVLYAWIHNGNYLQVEGYVTMMDGGAEAYHYTQVKMVHKTSGSVYEQSTKEWGYGEVWAYTDLIDPPSAPDNYKGRVFYGT